MNELTPELEDEDVRKYNVRIAVRVSPGLLELVKKHTKNKRVSKFIRNAIRAALKSPKKGVE
jgi:hypothetical protein